MDIFVKTGCLEDLSEKLRQMGNNIYEISSNYNTLIYEILNETEDDYKEEITQISDEIKKFLDEGFITIKKHENFIISSMEEYELVEKDIVGNAEAIANIIYSQSSTYISPGYTPGIDVLPYVNPAVIPLIIDDLPNSDINRIDRKNDINPVKIVGLINEIINGQVKTYEYKKVIMGLIGLIAPGALITGLSDIYPGFRPFNFIGLINSDDDFKGGRENGYGGRNYDNIIELIGQGFQTNYNLIEALRFAFILTELLKAGFNIGEFGNYNKLSDIIRYKNRHLHDNDYGDNTEDLVADENEDSEENEETNKDSEELVDESLENTDDTSYKDTNSEGRREYGYNGLYSDMAYGNYESEYTAEKTYHSELKGSESNSYEMGEDLSESMSADGKSLISDEEISKQASSVSGSSGGENVSSYGSSSSDDLGVSGLGISTLNTSNDVISASVQQAESVVNYKSKNSNANNVYSRILASVYGNEGSVMSRKSTMALAGTGAATLGGMGTLASIASETVSGGNGAVLNQIAGALSFNNLFDFVGKAQICSIDWLSELTNVLETV